MAQESLPLAVKLHVRLESIHSRVRPSVFTEGEEETQRPLIVREQRFLGEARREVVLLDSPASMANRMEENLYSLRGEIKFNDILVKIGEERFSQWQLPHRIYDAAIRDSTLEEKPFFETELGQRIARGNLEDLFVWAPNALIFGAWNSHAQAGVGARIAPRIERAIIAEVVGLEPQGLGRPASRRDPLGIPGNAPLTEGFKDIAQKLNKKAKKFSDLGYGNIPPTLEMLDVSIQEAYLEVALTRLPWRQRGYPEEVQEVLWHLALLGVACLLQDGFLHLRSGTVLVLAERPPKLVHLPDGTQHSLPTKEELLEKLREALDRLEKNRPGYRWSGEELVLEASSALKEAYQDQENLRRDKQKQKEDKQDGNEG